MVHRETRGWWLFRKLDSEHTLFFPVSIEIERTDDGKHHGATVQGLEGRIVAAGETPAKAEQCALDLFREFVEYGLKGEKLDRFLSGTRVKHHRLKFPFEETEAWVEETMKILAKVSESPATAPKAKTGGVWARSPGPQLEPAGV